MKLHANARLSVKGRQLLVERIQDAGWSLSAAAEAAGISERTAQVAGPLPRAGSRRAAGPLLGAPRGGQPHRRASHRGDRGVAQVADDRR